MLEVEEALSRVLEVCPRGGKERVRLTEAAGRYAAEEVVAHVASPCFDNSGMDGYAVRSADTAAGARLKVVGEQPAGRALGLSVARGEAVRVFTGAPMPRGADAVVMQEDVGRDGDVAVLREAVGSGAFVRRRGADLCEGQTVLAPGDHLTAQRLALLASQGIGEVAVLVPPEAAVVTTGDELVGPGQELGEGELYESNGVMLEVLLGQAGAVRVARHHAGDRADETRRVIAEAAGAGGIVVVSGGVSVGEHDHVRGALEAAGFEFGFWRVSVKPGKPLAFGRRGRDGALAFGLPGNPVSSFVTFHLFVAPAVRFWCGACEGEARPAVLPGVAGCRLENRGDRPHYLRGVMGGDGVFRPAGLQQSHALAAMGRCNALARLGAGATVEEGGALGVILC